MPDKIPAEELREVLAHGKTAHLTASTVPYRFAKALLASNVREEKREARVKELEEKLKQSENLCAAAMDDLVLAHKQAGTTDEYLADLNALVPKEGGE